GSRGMSTTTSLLKPTPWVRRDHCWINDGSSCACWARLSTSIRSSPRQYSLPKRNNMQLLRQNLLAGKQLGYGFAPAHQMVPVAVHHDLGGASAGVVIGRHDKAVGSCRTNRQQVTFFHYQCPFLAEKVSGFANWSDHIIVAAATLTRCHRHDIH